MAFLLFGIIRAENGEVFGESQMIVLVVVISVYTHASRERVLVHINKLKIEKIIYHGTCL